MDEENKEIMTNEAPAQEEVKEPKPEEMTPQEAAAEAAEGTKEAENASNEPEAQPAEEPAPEDVPAEVAGAKGEEEKKKKDSRLPFIITIIVILLLFSLAFIIALSVRTTNENPDAAIARLINENTKGEAKTAFEGYCKAKKVGYLLNDLLLEGKKNVILWDEKTDCYVLYNDSKLEFSPKEYPGEGYDLWIYVNDVPESSPYSVYWHGTNKVTKEVEVEEGEFETQTFYYTEHEYNVTVNSDSRTYTCTEEGCGFTYTVKNAN